MSNSAPPCLGRCPALAAQRPPHPIHTACRPHQTRRCPSYRSHSHSINKTLATQQKTPCEAADAVLAHARPPLQAHGASTATVAVAAACRLGVRLKAEVLASTELGRRPCSCPESSQSVKPPSGQVSESKTCFLLAFATARAHPAPCTAARDSEQQEHRHPSTTGSTHDGTHTRVVFGCGRDAAGRTMIVVRQWPA